MREQPRSELKHLHPKFTPPDPENVGLRLVGAIYESPREVPQRVSLSVSERESAAADTASR